MWLKRNRPQFERWNMLVFGFPVILGPTCRVAFLMAAVTHKCARPCHCVVKHDTKTPSTSLELGKLTGWVQTSILIYKIMIPSGTAGRIGLSICTHPRADLPRSPPSRRSHAPLCAPLPFSRQARQLDSLSFPGTGKRNGWL